MAFLSGLLPLLGSAVSALAPKVLPAIGEGVGRFAKGLEKGRGFGSSLKSAFGIPTEREEEEYQKTGHRLTEDEIDAFDAKNREIDRKLDAGIPLTADEKLLRPITQAQEIPAAQIKPITSINDLNNERTLSGEDNNVANIKLHSNRMPTRHRSLNSVNSRRAMFKKLQSKNRRRPMRRYARYL